MYRHAEQPLPLVVQLSILLTLFSSFTILCTSLAVSAALPRSIRPEKPATTILEGERKERGGRQRGKESKEEEMEESNENGRGRRARTETNSHINSKHALL